MDKKSDIVQLETFAVEHYMLTKFQNMTKPTCTNEN